MINQMHFRTAISVHLYNVISAVLFHTVYRRSILSADIRSISDARRTDRTSECDNLEIPEDPVILRQAFHKIVFHFLRIRLLRHPKPPGNAFHAYPRQRTVR